MCGKMVEKGRKTGGISVGKAWEKYGEKFEKKCTVYSYQCTVYIVQCTMCSKVVIFSLFKEPQCSSVWGVERFAMFLLCLTPPEESSH